MKPTDSSSLIRSIVQVPPEVAAAVDDVVERLSCGENVRVEELCEQYPDFAGEIRSVFPCLSALAELRRGASKAGEDAVGTLG